MIRFRLYAISYYKIEVPEGQGIKAAESAATCKVVGGGGQRYAPGQTSLSLSVIRTIVATD